VFVKGIGVYCGLLPALFNFDEPKMEATDASGAPSKE